MRITHEGTGEEPSPSEIPCDAGDMRENGVSATFRRVNASSHAVCRPMRPQIFDLREGQLFYTLHGHEAAAGMSHSAPCSILLDRSFPRVCRLPWRLQCRAFCSVPA